MSEENKNKDKRKNSGNEESSSDSEDTGWVGPLPTEAVPVKKRKGKCIHYTNFCNFITFFKTQVLHHEKLYLENMPDAECYEKSYMHRDVITHIVVTKTDFIVTASNDGHVKFWKKMEEGIEFVKHFRSHLSNLLIYIVVHTDLITSICILTGVINALTANANGTYLCTASSDKSLKIFDVINFDMINMIKIQYVPQCAEWVSSAGDAISSLAV